ncbi:MAG: bifunctional nuclease family protein [Bacteroidota bacterium]|nr:bifunctional nuclease family protein [Bacteroidota bacterium]
MASEDNKIELQILGISSGQIATSYTLILEEVDGDRKLPIIIGVFEAQAIAIEIEKIIPTRPMTHDLIKNLSDSFNITIREAIIHKLEEGIFFAYLICNNGTSEEVIDARTSDAIALAVRFKCPIYTYESIMNEAGITLNEEDQPEPVANKENTPSPKSNREKSQTDYTSMDKSELDRLLEIAIEDENYIVAAKLRDELTKRGFN